MFPRHDSLPKSNGLHVSPLWSPTKRPPCSSLCSPLYFPSCFSIKRPSCFPFMAPYDPIKKIMQKDNAKAGKISIFSSLDVKLEFLTSRVELTQFSVGSSRVELKIWAIRLESDWKCEQLDPISIRVQNVNSKLDLTISLLVINISNIHLILCFRFALILAETYS